MGHGTPPVQRCLDLGLRPSLSVDVETTVSTDLFAQMRSVLTLQRAQINDRRLKGEENLPKVLTSRDVMEFATIEGARAVGLESRIGTLTPGKEADVIMLRTDRINVTHQRPDRRRGARDGLVERRLGVHRRQGAQTPRPTRGRGLQPRSAHRVRVAGLRGGEVRLQDAVDLAARTIFGSSPRPFCTRPISWSTLGPRTSCRT